MRGGEPAPTFKKIVGGFQMKKSQNLELRTNKWELQGMGNGGLVYRGGCQHLYNDI